jgi:hypothetical protein
MIPPWTETIRATQDSYEVTLVTIGRSTIPGEWAHLLLKKGS